MVTKPSLVNWYIYLARCRDNSLYTGITTELSRRTLEHNSVQGGAKYTKSRQPITIIYSELVHSKSEALKREAMIKRLTRTQKLELIDKI